MFETVIERCEYGRFIPHKRHEWRDGFLWLRKHVCHGVSERGMSEEDLWVAANPSLGRIVNTKRVTTPSHRHRFKLMDKFSFGPKSPNDLLWYCWGCQSYRVTDRQFFWSNGMRNLEWSNPIEKLGEPLGACGKTDAECTC